MLLMIWDECYADDRDANRHALGESAQLAADAAKDRHQDYPHESQNKKALYVAERDRLRDALQHEIRQLGTMVSSHQIAETVDRFRQENARALEEQVQRGQELAEEIRDAAQEAVPDPISDFLSQYQEMVRERCNARKSHHGELAMDLSNEAKDALRESFLEEQRTRHRELKDSLKIYRNEIRNIAESGDRRISE